MFVKELQTLKAATDRGEIQLDKYIAARNDTVRLIFTVCAGIGVAATTVIALLNFRHSVEISRVSSQAAASEQYSRAVELLSSFTDSNHPNVMARFGAVYSLGSLASHNLDESHRVEQVLSAYIRSEVSLRYVAFDESLSATRGDVQAAIYTLSQLQTGSVSITEPPDLFQLDQLSDLHGTMLARANFYRLSLRQTNLSGSVLYGAQLYGANVRYSNFSAAVLSHADLRSIDATGARFDGAIIDHADLTNATLSRADFSHASLQHAVLENADLRNSVFPEANFGNAIVRDANFAGADLRSTDLTAAIGLTIEQLQSATEFDPSRLPTYIDRELLQR